MKVFQIWEKLTRWHRGTEPVGSSKGRLEKKYLTLVVSVCVYIVCMGVCAWVCICVHSACAWGVCVCMMYVRMHVHRCECAWGVCTWGMCVCACIGMCVYTWMCVWQGGWRGKQTDSDPVKTGSVSLTAKLGIQTMP